MTSTSPTNCAVLFADISGSSQLYAQLGNQAAKQLINAILVNLAEIISSYHGRIIKTIGDEIMASFDNCDRAVKAALELQLSCLRQSGPSQLKLRIGIDFGEVLQEQNDLFRETMNNAAFLTSIASRGKILISAAALQKLTHSARENCSEYDKIILKGQTQKTSIYRISWEQSQGIQDSEATQHVGNFEFTRGSHFQVLELAYKGQSYLIDPTKTPFLIGRNETESTLFISSSFASRDHCRIIYSRGKFILSDHSTNGTYIAQNMLPEIYLQREELPLLESGRISIGQPGKDAGAEILTFNLR
jgi:adenylate cyclase